MANEENKVQFGLRNVHYAIYNETEATYATPVPVPGAVNLSLDAEGDLNKFYADDIAYFVTSNNNGYSGDLEIARIPDKMLQEIWGYTQDSTSKVITENADSIAKTFALLFQISGDKNASHFVMYACTATRPSLGSKTKEETTEPNTQTISITAVPRADGKVFAKTTAETPAETVTNWYKSVFVAG